MLFRLLVATAALAAAVSLCGCYRLQVFTQVETDGSFARTLTYQGPSVRPGVSVLRPPAERVFAVPRSAGWELERTGAEGRIVAVRRSAPGAVGGDDWGIRLGWSRPERLLSNTVSVRWIEPGKWEYREVIRWRGPAVRALVRPDPSLQAIVRAALPEAAARDGRSVRLVCLAIQQQAWRALFGPGDPLLGVYAVHPDDARRRMRHRLLDALRDILARVFGTRLTPSEEETARRRIVPALFADPWWERRDQEIPDPVAVLVRVRLPGPMLETNGEVDPETGEAVWSFFSGAPAAGALTLTAVGQAPAP